MKSKIPYIAAIVVLGLAAGYFNLQTRVQSSLISAYDDQITQMNAEMLNLRELVLGLQTSQAQMQQELVSRNAATGGRANSSFYYDPSTIVKQRTTLRDLQDYIWRWSWPQDAYTEDKFDCSEMSAYIERKLELEGFHTYIVVGPYPEDETVRHAWLLVEIENEKYVPIEPTKFSIVYPGATYYAGYFKYDEIWEDITQACDWSSDDFDWWNS